LASFFFFPDRKPSVSIFGKDDRRPTPDGRSSAHGTDAGERAYALSMSETSVLSRQQAMHDRLARAAGRRELAAGAALRLRSTITPEARLSYFEVRSPKRNAALRLDAPFFVIGRSERIPIFHDDQSISREHCAVVVKKLGVRIRDLGSKNGVIVNGTAVARYAEADLKFGDSLQVGATLLVLREGEPKLKVPVPPAKADGAKPVAETTASPNVGPALAVPPSGPEPVVTSSAPKPPIEAQPDEEATVALRDEDAPPLIAAGDLVPEEFVEEI